jgi:hypothetical protein
MAWTDPPTFVSGGTVTAANLNILGEDLLYLKGITDGVTISGAQVTRSAAQSITTGTSTTVSFSAESWDYGGWWSSGTAITVPSGAIPSGYTSIIIECDADGRFEANSSGVRIFNWYKNGSQQLPGISVSAIGGGDATDLGMSRKFSVVSGDVISLRCYQNSGTSLDLSSVVVTVVRYAPAE